MKTVKKKSRESINERHEKKERKEIFRKNKIIKMVRKKKMEELETKSKRKKNG